MTVIEYCCLVEGSETVHVLRPQLTGANDNQYVLIFQGARDWSLLGLVGDWEYASVWRCLDMAANRLADDAARRTGTFAVGSLARGPLASEHAVGAEVSFAKVAPDSGDMFGRFTIRLADDAQAPFMFSRKWRGIDDRTFRIYRTDAELALIGRLLQRLDDAYFEPVLESRRSAWCMPSCFNSLDNLEQLAMTEKVGICKEHITEMSPGGFINFWLALFDGLELPYVAKCPDCKGLFSRRTDQQRRKKCLGCYRRTKPTTYSQADIDNAAVIAPWLRRVVPPIEDITDFNLDWPSRWP